MQVFAANKLLAEVDQATKPIDSSDLTALAEQAAANYVPPSSEVAAKQKRLLAELEARRGG